MDSLDINIDELKNTIDKHVNSMINDYLQKKLIRFIKDVSTKYNVDYDELIQHFNMCANAEIKSEKTNASNTCKGITKTGASCTHKCIPGSLYCKKHIKKTQQSETTHEDSFFPAEQCVC